MCDILNDNTTASLEKVSLNLVKFVLEPYCYSNNIKLDELIVSLYKYHLVNKDKINDIIEVEVEDVELVRENKVHSTEKRRGRPPGSKNKPRNDSVSSVVRNGGEKRKRGRPKGSKNKR